MFISEARGQTIRGGREGGDGRLIGSDRKEGGSRICCPFPKCVDNIFVVKKKKTKKLLSCSKVGWLVIKE